MIRLRHHAVFILLALPVLGQSAYAASTSLGVQDVAVITNDAGEGRILIRTQDIGDMRSAVLGRATLILPAGGNVEQRRLHVQVHPITRTWDAYGVDWNSGWSRPGGDYLDDVYARCTIDLAAAAGTIGIDVTNIVLEILDGSVEAHGFLLTVPPHDGNGLPPADLVRFQGVRDGRLEISYRTVGRGRPGRVRR
jgi:hypothetical protein